MPSIRFLICLIAFGLLAQPSAADSWAMPTVEQYFSADRQVRLTITPRDLSSQLDYFAGKVRHDAKAGQRRGSTQNFPRGVLQRFVRGRWRMLWDSALVNDVAPVSALVADSGRYIVTFDNWHIVGLGPNVIVIYGAGGRLIRSLRLEDVLPKEYISALQRSVSSLWWSGRHRMAAQADEVILSIVVPATGNAQARSHVELALDLATGRVHPVDPAAWRRAVEQAAVVAKANAVAAARAHASFIAPLLGPAGIDETDWHGYLREAFFRSAPDWKEDFPSTTVLRAPGATDYAPSEGWVREALTEKAMPDDVRMFASPSSPEALIGIFKKTVATMPSGALKSVQIYVAVPAAFKDRVAAVLHPTGATFIFLDPAKPIPQRKERLR